MSSYVQGQIDQRGRFFFVETSGRLGILYPDGEIFTVAGWVTDPNKVLLVPTPSPLLI